MANEKKRPAPLEFKPDLDEAARRWEAFYAGELIDRPLVCVSAPREGFAPAAGRSYYERVHGELGSIIDSALTGAEGTFWGGECVPAFCPSFGPDEVAAFCGGELTFSDESPNTNWSVPFVEDWEAALPLALHADDALWPRMLEFYRRAAEKMAGKMLLSVLDLHTNMDILAAARGPQRLCMDLIETPELIDRAMADARAVFPKLWQGIRAAGRMDETGYCHLCYSMEGAAILQCDFSCMISPAMFRRWVLPALEEEARIARHVVYHWDGPGALVHTDDLLASEGLHTLSYVPGAGHGGHIDHLDLLKRVQRGGKAVHVWGSPEQLKLMHRELEPAKVLYTTGAKSVAEAEALLAWFVRNT